MSVVQESEKPSAAADTTDQTAGDNDGARHVSPLYCALPATCVV